MLHVTIPFTNEVVFSSRKHAVSRLDEVVVNRFDEVRGAIRVSAKSFHVEEIAVYIVNLKCSESVLVSIRIERNAWLMIFTLQGLLEVNEVNSDVDLKLKAGSHYSLFPVAKGSSDMVIQGDVNLFVVELSSDAIKRMLTDEENASLKQRISLRDCIITPEMFIILNSVTQCVANNCLHRIFLAAKTLELLFLDVEQLKGSHNDEILTIRTEDLEKLRQAKRLIAMDIQSPCSLIELAHKVGLNDFKLKKGFKEAFGTTVFGHLFDIRMEKAKTMLSASDFTIGEVAHEVGYKNAHHFTAAFKRKFGYLPSDLRQK